jgi:hypothetical protein
MPAAGQLWNIDWLNANSQRKYPLSEEATLRDTSDSFTLPNDLIVDFVWPVHADPTVDPTLFHVMAVAVFGLGVTLTIGYNGTAVGTVTVDSSGFTANKAYFVQGTGDFYDSVGKIVIGTLDTILQYPGAYAFDAAGGRFEAAAVRPDVRGVSALYLKNGDDLSPPIQGDVVLQAGSNMVLNYVPGPGSEPDRIVFSAVSGAGLNQECDCAENAALPCIKTINGIEPDVNGDFTLLGDDCLTLEVLAGGIQLVDNCSKPCCGCSELQVVLDTTEFFAQQLFALEQLASRVEAQMEVIRTNLISSKSGTTT